MTPPGELMVTVVGRWGDERLLVRLEDGETRDLAVDEALGAADLPPAGARVLVRLGQAGELVGWETAAG